MATCSVATTRVAQHGCIIWTLAWWEFISTDTELAEQKLFKVLISDYSLYKRNAYIHIIYVPIGKHCSRCFLINSTYSFDKGSKIKCFARFMIQTIEATRSHTWQNSSLII